MHNVICQFKQKKTMNNKQIFYNYDYENEHSNAGEAVYMSNCTVGVLRQCPIVFTP